MRRFLTRRLVVTLALASCASGCSDAPSLVPVTGVMTLDGKPLAHKNIRFIPEPGTLGTGAGGDTNANGEYTLLAVRPGAIQDAPGIPSGPYKVVITEPLIPVDDPIPLATGSGPAPAIGISSSKPKQKQMAIPARYTKVETTPLRVEVPPDGGAIKLELTYQ